MHFLEESHILLFLVQLLLLLGLARALGIWFQRFGQPAITAEILVGILLGPTILGRVWPQAHQAIFPADVIQQTMLDAVAWLGILFFLLYTGLDTDFASAWRQRKEATVIAFSDLILPMAIAFVPCILLPDRYLGDPSQRLLFALFVSTIMTISALPVTARIMQDLNIYRTDTGLLIMGALTINDVAGWVVFALILGFATEYGMDLAHIPVVIAATAVFAGLFLSVGRRLTNQVIESFHRWNLPEPGTSLTFICMVGLVGGIITLFIGIHALFGFFIAGIMAGGAKALSENTRQVIAQMVRAILVPVFFASIGLKVDFLAGFDLMVVLMILAVGIFGRFAGAWVGIILTRRPMSDRHIVSVAHVPGGEMQIVVGLLALEYGVVAESIFVAIVLGAILTSVIVGPWMKAALARARRLDVLEYFSREGLRASLASETRDDCIAELAHLASTAGGIDRFEEIEDAVLARESIMGTALGEGAAVPHARLDQLDRPIVVVGRSAAGIDWNAPDGEHVHLVFLVITPVDGDDVQLRILRGIAEMLHDAEARKTLFAASDEATMWQALKNAASMSQLNRRL